MSETPSTPVAMMDGEAIPPARLHHRFDHRWHVAINRAEAPGGWEAKRFMYDAKHAAHEVPRLAAVFGRERRGQLTKTHIQCSHSSPEPVPENYTTCCLGARCSECPFLLAIEAQEELTEDQRDLAKAWTCVTHIISKGGDVAGEGYILTVDDRMYWENLYRSMAGPPPQENQHGV